VPQVPPGSPGLSGKNIRLGDGSVDVSADHEGKTYTTKVSTALDVNLTIGHTVPHGTKVSSATLNGKNVCYKALTTNRGEEVVVDAPAAGAQELVVEIR
jgi:hypothetical protein